MQSKEERGSSPCSSEKELSIPIVKRKLKMKTERIEYPLCEAQAYFPLAGDKSTVYNAGFHAFIREDCHLDLLEKCWNRVVESNDALRMRVTGRIKVRQYFVPYEYETLSVVHVNGYEEFLQLEEKERNTAVPLHNSRLCRATLVDCGTGTGGMIVCMHNICCDGYGMELIFKQLESLYACALKGEEFPPYKERSYVEYLKLDRSYRESEEYPLDKKWWRRKYWSLHHYTIPAGRPSFQAETKRIQEELSAEDYSKLLSLCEETKASVSSVIMSVMALATYRQTGKKCFCLYTLNHGRRNFAMKQTVGCMVETNPVFYQIDPSCTFTEMAKKGYLDYLEALQHGRIPFFWHVIYSYFQSLKCGFVFTHFWMYISPMEFGKLSNDSKLGLEVFDEDGLWNPFYCAIYNVPEENTVRLDLNYQAAKFSEKKIGKIMDGFNETLKWCLSHSGEQVSGITG